MIKVFVIDAAHFDNADPLCPSGAPENETLLVIRNADKAPPDAFGALGSLIGRAGEAGQHVAVTSEPLSKHPAAATALLGRLSRTVLVPPLRLRCDELPELARSVLKQIAPHGKNRISPEALDVIRGYLWPGNIPQLRLALTTALHNRPVGEIQVGDLPGFCRTTCTRHLTALEISERDSIIAALADHDGNRVRTAAALGISRSSLYRKIRVYGLSGV